MPGDVSMTITGADELRRLLRQLAPEVAARVANTALRAAARPILRRAQELVPQPGRGRGYATGRLRSSLMIVTDRAAGRRVDDLIKVLIGIRRPRSSIAHLVEFGVPSRGIAAQSFLRASVDERGAEAVRILSSALGRGIIREAERLARTTGAQRGGGG